MVETSNTLTQRSRLAFACERTPPSESRFTSAALDAARTRGDPLADGVVPLLREAKVPFAASPDFIAQQAALSDGPCRRLQAQLDAVPAWVDFARMEPGSDVTLRHVVPAGFALLVGSLVESYAGLATSRVLVGTGRLVEGTHRRLMETVQFVTHLAVDRGPRPGTPSAREALLVRLLHAAARRRVLDTGWSVETTGQPVSQEDLALVLTLFSHVFRRSLECLGVSLSAAQHDAIHHCWRYTGYLLGIDEPLLPTSVEEEEALYLALTARNDSGPVVDEPGRRLTKALLDATGGRTPYLVPRAGLEVLVRRCVGPHLADRLGVSEPHRALAVLVDTAVTLESIRSGVLNRVSALHPARVHLGERLVEWIQRAGGAHHIG